MLSGSAILRVGVLIVAAAILAGLVQMMRPHEDGRTVEAHVAPTAPATGKAGTQAALPPAVTRPVVPVAPVPQIAPSPVPTPQVPAPAPAPFPVPPPSAAAPVPPSPSPLSPSPLSPSPLSPSPLSPSPLSPSPSSPFAPNASVQNFPAPNSAAPRGPAPAPAAPAFRMPDVAARPAPTTGEAAIDNAAETAGPRGVAVIDLNTGSVSELNGLRGGGMIGRAIVQKRPYASVGDLLSKRVLSRAVYERIKDQVTVR